MQHDELNRAWEQLKNSLWNEGKPETCLSIELLEKVPQLMDPGGLRAEGVNWNMMPGLFKRTPGLSILIVKPLIWDKWCKEPCAQWEPTQEAGDFLPRVALIICYSKFQDLLKDKLRDQMTISMTLAYVPEHWQLTSFQESSYIINTAREHGDPQGIISLTRVHKKAPFLPDVSYREYGQHMTIALLIPPDEEGLGLCGPPQDFAVGAFHCKSQGSRKSRKLIFWAPPAFRKALPGELLALTGCNGKTWGGTSSGPDQHEVQMAPLDTFMKLHTTNGIPVLPEYTFALCSPGTWPFSSTMDINILPEACLAYDTPVDSENAPDDPVITEQDTKAGPSKKRHRCKGRSKPQSKSARANSSASKASPGPKNRKPQINEELAREVAQDLHLSSDGSDSENPDDTNQNTQPDESLQPPAGPVRTEPGPLPPGIPAPTPSMPTPQPTEVMSARENTTTTQGEGGDVGHGPIQPTTPVAKPAMPDTSHGAQQQPTAMPTVTSMDTTSPSPVPARPSTSSGLAGHNATLHPNAAALLPPGLTPGGPNLLALVADTLMADLAQSLAVTQARGNPNARAFSGMMTGLRQACGLMMEGFQEACLGVEVVVQKTLQEATAHDQAFTAKAARDLDLWTSALQPLFDTGNISEADMEARRAHARETRQVVSDQILGRSRQATQRQLPDGGTCLGGASRIICPGGGAMCSYPGESG